MHGICADGKNKSFRMMKESILLLLWFRNRKMEEVCPCRRRIRYKHTETFSKGSSVLLLQLGFVCTTYRKKKRERRNILLDHTCPCTIYSSLSFFCERTRGHCVEWKRREERERNNTETLVIRLQGLPRCAQPRHTQKKKKKKDGKVFLLRDSIRLYGGTVGGVCVCKVLYGLANTWRFWGGKSSCTADNWVGTVQGSKLLLWDAFEIGRHVPPALVLNRAHTEINIWKEEEESGLCLVGVVIMLRPDRQTSKKKREKPKLGFYLPSYYY